MHNSTDLIAMSYTVAITTATTATIAVAVTKSIATTLMTMPT